MSESLEFVRSAHPRAHTERARRGVEQHHSLVLDGLAQAYKTPLTAILSASAGLIEMGKLSETQADLVARQSSLPSQPQQEGGIPDEPACHSRTRCR